MSKEFATITLVKMYLALEAEAKKARETFEETKAMFELSEHEREVHEAVVIASWADRDRFARQAGTQLGIDTDDFIGAVNLYTEDPAALEAALIAEQKQVGA